MSHAPIDVVLILKRCQIERKEWKEWLVRKNGEYDKQQAELLEHWETGGFWYRLLWTKPGTDPGPLSNLTPKLRQFSHDDAIDRIEELEALATKAIPIHGTIRFVYLTKSDARFLDINKEELYKQQPRRIKNPSCA